MRYDIFHEIQYRYSKPVYLEPHTFFLRPREDAHHRLIRHELKIDPEPVLLWTSLDSLGNNASVTTFQSVWDQMTIRVESEVEVIHPNPFDYILDLASVQLPVYYSEDTRRQLNAYFSDEFPMMGPVKRFSDRIAMDATQSTLHFLTALCQELYSTFKKIHRGEGGPWPAEVTLEKKEGACRDLTVLFMECCRAQGLAARFTSGYYCEPDTTGSRQELHAWPEVYLEGAGWRGFDPTVGLTCAQSHVPLASSYTALQVLPVHGTFRGDSATSQMVTQVSISKALIPAL